MLHKYDQAKITKENWTGKEEEEKEQSKGREIVAEELIWKMDWVSYGMTLTKISDQAECFI